MPQPIVFANTASTQFERLKDKKLKERIISALEYIAKEPSVGKPLQAEFKGYYSYRIGDYRIVYGLGSNKKHIGIIRIAHRREVYR